MTTSLQAALEAAARRLPPEQAPFVPESLTWAFMTLPSASRRALTVGRRLDMWLSMMTYEPAAAQRYAFLMAGGNLPSTASMENRDNFPSTLAGLQTRQRRLRAADEMLLNEPGKFEAIEDRIGAYILGHSLSSGPPSVGRWALRTALGEDAMAVLSRSRRFKRLGSSQIQLVHPSCPIQPLT